MTRLFIVIIYYQINYVNMFLNNDYQYSFPYLYVCKPPMMYLVTTE